ncbi:MAG: site-specific integrase [Candidatus Pacearchaeota archaeon]
MWNKLWRDILASLYKKGNIIYISWYDFIKQKRLNRSLKLTATRKNWVKAKKIREALEKKLETEKSKYNALGIKQITIRDAFNHFLQNNIDKHPKTIKDYYRFYNKFKESFSEDEPCGIINKLSVERWLMNIKLLKQKRNSIFGYYKQLNHFLNFLFEYNYIPMFRINRDVKPKPEVVSKIVFTPEDLQSVFSNLDGKSKNFKLLIHVLYYTGLRASDVLNIDVNKIDLERRVLIYYSPKRKIYREVAFHEALVPFFAEVVNEQKERLLCYKTVESLQRAIRRYMKKIGFGSKGYTSRTFRKTFITLARKYGMDESVVKELVGHSHTSTTDKFYNRIDTDLMRRELTKYPTVERLIGSKSQ